MSTEKDLLLYDLYTQELNHLQLIEMKAPEPVLASSRRALRATWEKARKEGIDEQVFLACSKNLWEYYLEHSLNLEIMHSCREHVGYEANIERPCAHHKTSTECSLLCPHYKKKKDH